jgi:hypothetical protein
MLFYVGLHIYTKAHHFDRAFISVNRLWLRKGPFRANEWIMDSGAFTEISTYGEYRYPVKKYAKEIARWKRVGQLTAAVAQDWMCEPHIVKKTGKSVKEHQKLTVSRYLDLLACDPVVPIIPVLQGYHYADYLEHLEMYGSLLKTGAHVGVGSICKRNANAQSILNVLYKIKQERPDLRLHGFGVKMTALGHPGVRSMLYSADSLAWSYAARREGRDRNSWEEAKRFETEILTMCDRQQQDWIPPLI